MRPNPRCFSLFQDTFQDFRRPAPYRRRMRRGLIIAALAAASCSGPGPVSPAPVPPGASVAPVPPGASVATLAVSSFEVSFAGLSNSTYWYRPTMVLAETSGRSAARLQSISFSMPNGGAINIVGQGCLYTQLVSAGQSWNLDNVYFYCLDLDSRADISGLQVRVSVRFLDDEGRPGAVDGTATVK